MNPLNSRTLAPDMAKCANSLWKKKRLSSPPTIITISPAIKKPDMKLKSFFEKTTYKDNPTNVIAVSANASATTVGAVRESNGPRVNPETVVKLNSATMLSPGLRATNEAKKIRANCRINNII